MRRDADRVAFSRSSGVFALLSIRGELNFNLLAAREGHKTHLIDMTTGNLLREQYQGDETRTKRLVRRLPTCRTSAQTAEIAPPRWSRHQYNSRVHR